MIRIKVEEEEEVTPIESENEQIKRFLSLKFSSNNNNSLNNVVGGLTTSDTNSGNFSGTLKEPENNVVVPMKVVSNKQKKKKPKQKLDNFTTDSFAVGLKSIKTEPAELLSLSTTFQILNQSTEFDQSIQQQQHSFLLPKIEPIVPESQEVPLSLDQSLSLILNSNSYLSTNSNNDNVSGTLKPPQKPPQEKNVVVAAAKVPKKVVPKKKPKQLDNSTTNSVAVGSKSIKTEPVESSLSLTTQLNNSLNIQSLLRQNRIQNGWTTNEQSIPIGTQQQQQSLLSTKIEPIVSEIHQEVPLSLDQSSSFPNLNSKETTTNCDTNIMKIFGPRACLCRRTKLNVCYSVPNKPIPEVPRVMKMVPETPPTLPKGKCDEYQRKQQWKTQNRRNLVAAQNSKSNQHSGSFLISGLDPSSSTGPSLPLPEAAAVPLLVGKKPLPLGIPPLTLEEKKARRKENWRLRYLRNKAIPKQPLDPEVKAEKLRQRREYRQRFRQQLLATGTPEQLEQIKLKDKERFRRFLEKESEEQRKQRLAQKRQYGRTVAKQRMELEWKTMTPEEREKRRAIRREYSDRYRKKMEEKKKGLEESQTAQSQISIF